MKEIIKKCRELQDLIRAESESLDCSISVNIGRFGFGVEIDDRDFDAGITCDDDCEICGEVEDGRKH